MRRLLLPALLLGLLAAAPPASAKHSLRLATQTRPGKAASVHVSGSCRVVRRSTQAVVGCKRRGLARLTYTFKLPENVASTVAGYVSHQGGGLSSSVRTSGRRVVVEVQLRGSRRVTVRQVSISYYVK